MPNGGNAEALPLEAIEIKPLWQSIAVAGVHEDEVEAQGRRIGPSEDRLKLGSYRDQTLATEHVVATVKVCCGRRT